MATRHHQIARAQCSAPSIAVDDRCSTPTRGDYARLGLVTLPSRWNATILMLAFRCAKNTCFFNFFDSFWLFQLFDSESYGKQPINISSFIDIRILIAARHGPSEAPKLIHTSIPHIAVATSLSPDFQLAEERCLAILGILRQLRWGLQTAMRDGILRATSVLIGQYVCSIAVAYLDVCRIR